MNTFKKERRVYFQDTDAAGIVYFANFLSFAHQAFEEHLLDKGIDLKALLAEGNELWPVSRTECNFKSPVRLGDLLQIEGEMLENGESGIRTTFKIFNTSNQKLAAEAIIEQTFISAHSWKRIPIPSVLLA